MGISYIRWFHRCSNESITKVHHCHSMNPQTSLPELPGRMDSKAAQRSQLRWLYSVLAVLKLILFTLILKSSWSKSKKRRWVSNWCKINCTPCFFLPLLHLWVTGCCCCTWELVHFYEFMLYGSTAALKREHTVLHFGLFSLCSGSGGAAESRGQLLWIWDNWKR